MELNQLERHVMDKLLAGGDPTLDVLRQQYRASNVIKRELTGHGFYVTFSVPPGAARLDGSRSLHLGDVSAGIEGLQHGAGFVLFVRDGAIDMLEGYSYDEPWPPDVSRFRLSYIGGGERDLPGLWAKYS